jgi:hypothetical protein
MAGMAGRIVVGGPGDPGWSDATAGEGLPSVERILREGVVRRG